MPKICESVKGYTIMLMYSLGSHSKDVYFPVLSLINFSQSIGSDLIVLPSSVHETILLPLNTSIHIDCLRATVYDINRTMVNRSDFLSDNVYYFYRKAKQLTIA